MDMKEILVVDGQGGRIGQSLIEEVRRRQLPLGITAIGTNATATSVMLKAGADRGATGENPLIVACRSARVIAGPIGILVADAFLGEMTPAMALAVAQSSAVKLLIPMNHCNNVVVGLQNCPIAVLIGHAADWLAGHCQA